MLFRFIDYLAYPLDIFDNAPAVNSQFSIPNSQLKLTAGLERGNCREQNRRLFSGHAQRANWLGGDAARPSTGRGGGSLLESGLSLLGARPAKCWLDLGLSCGRRDDGLFTSRRAGQPPVESHRQVLGTAHERAGRRVRDDGRGVGDSHLGLGDQLVPHPHPPLLLRHAGKPLGRVDPTADSRLARAARSRGSALLLRRAARGDEYSVGSLAGAAYGVGQRDGGDLLADDRHDGCLPATLGRTRTAGFPAGAGALGNAARQRRGHFPAVVSQSADVGRVFVALCHPSAGRAEPLLLFCARGAASVRPADAVPR